jgi:hypothetical protein
VSQVPCRPCAVLGTDPGPADPVAVRRGRKFGTAGGESDPPVRRPHGLESRTRTWQEGPGSATLRCGVTPWVDEKPCGGIRAVIVRASWTTRWSCSGTSPLLSHFPPCMARREAGAGSVWSAIPSRIRFRPVTRFYREPENPTEHGGLGPPQPIFASRAATQQHPPCSTTRKDRDRAVRWRRGGRRSAEDPPGLNGGQGAAERRCRPASDGGGHGPARPSGLQVGFLTWD